MYGCRKPAQKIEKNYRTGAGIDRMVEEDIACEDMLSQINAAKSALHRVGQIVLEGHLHHCVLDGIEHGDAEETIAKFSKAVERFSNMG